MRRILLLAVPLFLLVFSTCQDADITPMEACTFQVPEGNGQHPLNQKVQSLLEEYVRKGLPGISLMFRDQSGIWVGSAGFADLDKRIPMKPCVVSKVASITKILVGTLAMKLWEEKSWIWIVKPPIIWIKK